MLPNLGDVRIDRITPARIEALYTHLDNQGVSRGQQRVAHRMLNMIFREAWRLRLVEPNPMERVRAPDPPGPGRWTVWTADELAAFLRIAQQDALWPLWRTAAMTGMRRGEVCGLGWEAVDMKGARLRVVRQLAEDGYGGWELRTPKLRSSLRESDLDPATVQILRSHKKAQTELRMLVGPGWHDSGFVFTEPDGNPLCPSSVSARYGKLVRRADVRPARLHDLRHSHASLLIADGWEILTVAQRLGHSSAAFTLSRYSHAVPDDRPARAARAFAALVDA